MIKEVIVVEGKDDIAAVKRAVEGEMICTSGMGINPAIIHSIQEAAKRCGIIILTDPDYPGDRIRQIVSENVENCKHAYLTQEQARCKKTGKIGVEYAKPADIIQALENAKAEKKTAVHRYTMDDLLAWRLTGPPVGGRRREKMAHILGIGKVNAKQFLRKINCYDIKQEEIENALAQLERAEE